MGAPSIHETVLLQEAVQALVLQEEMKHKITKKYICQKILFLSCNEILLFSGDLLVV